MVVCHCLRVSDRVISRFTKDPSITAEDITRECGAGGRCGGCVDAIEEILDQARARAPAARRTAPAPGPGGRRRRGGQRRNVTLHVGVFPLTPTTTALRVCDEEPRVETFSGRAADQLPPWRS